MGAGAAEEMYRPESGITDFCDMSPGNQAKQPHKSCVCLVQLLSSHNNFARCLFVAVFVYRCACCSSEQNVGGTWTNYTGRHSTFAQEGLWENEFQRVEGHKASLGLG